MSGRSEYLLALYIAGHRGDPPVSPGRVAERLGRSPATAAEMCGKLDDDGLVAYEPYEGTAMEMAAVMDHEVAVRLVETLPYDAAASPAPGDRPDTTDTTDDGEGADAS